MIVTSKSCGLFSDQALTNEVNYTSRSMIDQAHVLVGRASSSMQDSLLEEAGVQEYLQAC